jgi:hypothetical protein
VFVLVYPGFFPRPEVPCPVPPRAAFLLCSLSLASVEMLRASSEAIASDRALRAVRVTASMGREMGNTRHRHEAVLPQSMLPCLWSSLPLELRFHDHLDIGLVGSVDLLSISFRFCHPSYPRVIFCFHLGINAISVKFVLITSALHGIRFHEFSPF